MNFLDMAWVTPSASFFSLLHPSFPSRPHGGEFFVNQDVQFLSQKERLHLPSRLGRRATFFAVEPH